MQPAIPGRRRSLTAEFLRDHAGPFRRSDLAKALWRTCTPRNPAQASLAAEAVIKALATQGAIQRHGHQHWMAAPGVEPWADGLPLVKLPIETRHPDTWVAVDLENGAAWRGTAAGEWKRIDAPAATRALAVIHAELSANTHTGVRR